MRNKLAVISILLSCTLLSGCGIAYQMDVARQQEINEKNRILGSKGMSALNFILADDQVRFKTGEHSRCNSGCTLTDVVNYVNQNPTLEVLFFIGMRGYSGEFAPDYSYFQQYHNLDANMVIGNMIQNFQTPINFMEARQYNPSVLYTDFNSWSKALGLKELDRATFNTQLDIISANSQRFSLMLTMLANDEFKKSNQADKRKEEQFKTDNPEKRISIANRSPAAAKYPAIKQALGTFQVYTRESEDNLSAAYVKGLPMNAANLLGLVEAAKEDCQREAAYSGDNEATCMAKVSNDITLLASVANDSNIPGLTKSSAISEAHKGGYFDFGHAARLAKMHYSLCTKKGNEGYVAMNTIAVPCSGTGEILRLKEARNKGLL